MLVVQSLPNKTLLVDIKISGFVCCFGEEVSDILTSLKTTYYVRLGDTSTKWLP